MEDIRLNVDDALANKNMEIPITNCLSTPSKSQCNDNNFNYFNDSTNSKVVSQHNDSHIEKIETYIKEKIDEVAINYLKRKILADLKGQYPPSTTYRLNFSVMNSLNDHTKSLDIEIQFLQKELRRKNILSRIPLKILESKYCKANNLQNFNRRSSCLQEGGRESTASENVLRKNVKEVFVEKTKITDYVETTSLSHSTKQNDSNCNISNRVKKMRDRISTNNRGHEEKKSAIILEDSVIKHVNTYDTAENVNKCKVFAKRFSGAKVRCLKDHMKPSLCENPNHFVLHIGKNDLNSNKSLELIAKSITDVGSSLKNDSHDVSISSIVVTNDKFKEKAVQVNEKLEIICAERNIYFINHAKNILPQHLNKSKLLLNGKSSSILTSNFVKALCF